MSHLVGKFVWFEHAGPDPAAARAFYSSLFGWRVEDVATGGARYPMIENAGEGIGGLVGGPAPARWVTYVSVSDLDKAYAAALAAGAKSESAPTDFGPFGRGAAIADPVGARISLWRSAEADRPDREREPDGSWIWNELYATDVDAALKFYTGLLGYGVRSMDMGDQGTYHVLSTGQRGRGGVMRPPDPSMPAQWVPYVLVADCDATLAKAGPLGASVCLPATDIADVGRIGMLVDPQGAMIAMIRPAPMTK